MNKVIKNLLARFPQPAVSFGCFSRNYATVKRFYRKTNISFCDGKYEVMLDQRKLKTPGGKVFQVDNESLAIAVAAEWDAQRETIDRTSMHLTSLCNTAIDNPNRLTKVDLTNYIVNYLPTDTVLFQCGEEDDLAAVQTKEWDPVIAWFNERFGGNLKKSRDINTPHVSSETRMNVGKYLMSHRESALHGITYAVDSLKSVILTFAALDRFLTTERAVLLSRLEEEFQLGYWGRVEWAHDSSQQELQARVAAAVLFVYFNSSGHFVKEKIAV
ncbi:ATP synthase mitochondrial F1 complex assembly factor 2 [Lutzomyia longipalpis]|uniref:ATP synthase mitochondrial F1 complex assembly factor 2 n=1 Tax=Lutzomyia longipalpis TaxID=7200 RepID=UPI00248468C7|nr:ATP synthase mitochondrial F1 complex assembly factor 2 [Lutzomyia longipalpis]XP_055680691.1 ATP synthase mitochondrial F1 complex assembly factor 2 [Lutzomyia longipalpis]XP_055680692.1 ATP synthase mitochondrial F1 complex assembly factor 2 [Lutzomyia longipalpis]XP_055680693.1 ATP synthase mitochondrial F1 complex assembly factor 2 [Lutzomyia longipalpis]XP_055680694.1 ATP synthase mitochondrial F1 complex assembly factor 2 [Lutzomyia longipalpis]